jgi:hypothetical protein
MNALDNWVCRLSGSLKERFGGGAFELLEEAVLTPILRGFDNTAVLEAEDAHAGELETFASARGLA